MKARGTGLQYPRISPDIDAKDRMPAIRVYVVSKEGKRRDISECIRYIAPNTMAFTLDFEDALLPNDSYVEIVNRPFSKDTTANEASTETQVNQIPIIYKDPTPPTADPAPTVTSLIVGGSTQGDNKDDGRSFLVRVYAGGKEWPANKVAEKTDYCNGGAIKNGPFPPYQFEDFQSFEVPASGRLWVKASKHHDCEAAFKLEYQVQTYKWGRYIREQKAFERVPDKRYLRSYETNKVFYRGDEPSGTQVFDFFWKGA